MRTATTTAPRSPGPAPATPVRLPAGTYSVHISFDDGDAHKKLWLDNQTFSGTVEKTVEVGVQITEVSYLITNSGVDVGDKGEVRYFPQGPHDLGSITWAPSGKPVRLPAGTYNVHITFADGDAHKEIWLDNQSFSGKVDKTVEIGVQLTERHATPSPIQASTSATRGRSTTSRRPARPRLDHLGALGETRCACRRAPTTSTLRSPTATPTRRCGSTTKTSPAPLRRPWRSPVKTTDVSYVVTNDGVDTGGKSRIDYFPAGRHDGGIDWTNSGKTVRLPEGTYNVRVQFTDGDAHKEIWFHNQNFSGTVTKTVEVAVKTTDVSYVVTNNGVDTEQEPIDYFPPAGTMAGSTGPTRARRCACPRALTTCACSSPTATPTRRCGSTTKTSPAPLRRPWRSPSRPPT